MVVPTKIDFQSNNFIKQKNMKKFKTFIGKLLLTSLTIIVLGTSGIIVTSETNASNPNIDSYLAYENQRLKEEYSVLTSKLSEMEEGMNDINFVARVERIYSMTEFERQGKKGKVLSMVVSDGTERRLALWDSNTNGRTKSMKATLFL